MSPSVHAVLLVLTTVLLCWKAVPRSPAGCRVAGALVILPVVGLVLPEAIDRFLFEKDGLIEAVTEGALLPAVLRAARQRKWLLLLCTGLLLLEEVDYGQLFWEFPTPDWVRDLPANRSDRLNFHNVPMLGGLFRLAPLLLLGLPCLQARTFRCAGLKGILVAVLLSPITVCIRSTGVWDESIELALVAVAWVSWRRNEIRES